MEEKVLIKSERYIVKKTFKIMLILCVLLSLYVYVKGVLIHNISRHAECYDLYDNEMVIDEEFLEDNPSKLIYVITNSFSIDEIILYCVSPPVYLSIILGIIYLWLCSYELTVTDKRIYGKVIFGKRVNLPIDAVSSISATRLWKGVSVSTASGRISFRFIKNVDEIYKVMNNLLIERQQEKMNTVVATPMAPAVDEADQLKKYKELLDNDIITKEEFEAKKKQLLGF